MKTLEEIAYEAARAALADQESFVAGIRQRTGTLLAAHALVASFLGGTAIRAHGFHAGTWLAMTALVGGLVVAAVILAPWEMRFTLDADDLYARMSSLVSADANDATLDRLASAGFAYQSLRTQNAPRVRSSARRSAVLGSLMVVQTLLWLAALGLE